MRILTKITEHWLTYRNACITKEEKREAAQIGDPLEICRRLIDRNRLDHALWVLIHFLNKEQNIEWSIFASNQVIDVFEKQHPDKKIFRELIGLLKMYLKSYNRQVQDFAWIPLNDLYAKAYLIMLNLIYEGYDPSECAGMTIISAAAAVNYNEYIGQSIRWSIAVYLKHDQIIKDKYKLKLIRKAMSILKRDKER